MNKIFTGNAGTSVSDQFYYDSALCGKRYMRNFEKYLKEVENKKQGKKGISNELLSLKDYCKRTQEFLEWDF